MMRVQAYRNTCTESCEHGPGVVLSFDPLHTEEATSKGRSEGVWIDVDDGYKVALSLRGDRLIYKSGVNEPGIPLPDAMIRGIAREDVTL